MIILRVGCLEASPVFTERLYCFSYGCPSAAGGVARPTSPASAIIVSMYGAISRNDEEMGTVRIANFPGRESAKQKMRMAPTATLGDHLQKSIAASELSPRPEII